jgi:hypothetical protein
VGRDFKVGSGAIVQGYKFESGGIWWFGCPMFEGEDDAILTACQIGIGVTKGVQV